MEKRLEEALRQYKHNHGDGGFVFAYDKDTVDSIFADLRTLVERWRDRQRHWSRWKVGKASTYETVADELEKLLDGE